MHRSGRTAVAAEVVDTKCAAPRTAPGGCHGTLASASRAEVQGVDAAAGACPGSAVNGSVYCLCLNLVWQGNDAEVVPRRSDDEYYGYDEQCDDKAKPDKEAYACEHELA